MKNHSLLFLYITVIVLLITNCVREIDFSESENALSPLVVSGSFTNTYGLQKIFLNRPSSYKKLEFPFVENAQVRLIDDLGQTINFYTYTLEKVSCYATYAKGVPGHTYTLEIDLPNGHLYRSHPQIMPDPLPLDTLEVHGAWNYSNTAEGLVVREPFAFAYARLKAPALPLGHYLRWESDATYVFNEKSGQHQCFVNNHLNSQLLAIADLSKYEPGGVIYETVGKRKIDQAFEWKIAITAFQHSIGREAYEYWEKINQLLAVNGTIFDPPPAAVAGNIDNINQPDQPALGFFEVSSVDTFRIYTVNGQLGQEFLLQNYPYCDLHYFNGFPIETPRECTDCLTHLAGATYNVPWWWH